MRLVAFAMSVLALTTSAAAQSPPPTAEALARLVVERFARGSPAAFDSVFPLDDELPASSAPNAASVQAWGDFAPGRRLDARREGDRWVIDLFAPEGIYDWGWLVDGKPLRDATGSSPSVGPLTVRAKTSLARPLPM